MVQDCEFEMFSFNVSSEVSAKYEGLAVGMIEGKCEQNIVSDKAAFLEEKKEVEKNALNIQPLAMHPNVAAWRKVFKSFGVDQTKIRSSAEALIRRVQRGESIPEINGIVDVYNLISIKHILPMGGQDALMVKGGVELRLAKQGETFIRLGASEPEGVDEGEVVYADEEKILCSKWNYRDCEQAKITENTKEFVLFVDGAPGIGREYVEKATRDLAEHLNKYVKGCEARVVGIEPKI